MSFFGTFSGGAAGSLTWKDAVRVASTGDVPLTGATPLQIDGKTLVDKDRVLLKNQALPEQNGIYSIAISGGSYTLSRAADSNTLKEVVPNMCVAISEGNTQAEQVYQLITDPIITLDVTPLTFALASVTDHGLLQGLADDDHSQYLTTGRADTWLGTKSTTDLAEGTRLYFTDQRAKDAVISQTITNGVTNLSPSEDAVFDSLALKANTNLGNLTAPTAINQNLLFSADGTLDIGTASASRPNNIYAKTEVRVSDVSIWRGLLDRQSNLGIGSGTLSAIAGNGTTQGIGNLAIGFQAGQTMTTAIANHFVGYQAGQFYTGTQSTAFGYQALQGVSGSPGTGQANLGIGPTALQFVSSGAVNVAVGAAAMTGASANRITGSFNVAVGTNALWNITSGANNTAIGYSAMTSTATNLVTGSRNVALGQEALQNITSGVDNIAIGYRALRNSSAAPTTGSQNVVIGNSAGSPLDSGSGNVLIGHSVQASSTSASNEVNIGNVIKYQTGSGQGRIFIGGTAGADNTGTANTGIGEWTLRGSNGLNNATGAQNTAVGAFAMGQTYLTTGEQNAAFGANALTNVTTGSRNAAVGMSALNNLSTGEGNVAVGFSAGYTITTGNYNFALGRGVMTNGAAVTGDSNIGVGYNTLFNLTGGFYNIAFGQAAGTAITSGVSNICIGLRAGASITTESENVCLGTEAGYLKVGASNVYLGNSAGYRSATVSNELIIDNQARADRATELTDSLIVGKFDATVGNQTLRINGQAFLSQGEKHKSIHNQAGTANVITASINDYYIGVDTSSAAKTVNLPAAATAGQGFVLVIKDESGNAATAGRNITIDANGSETIDGALTQVINTNYGSASLMCSGSAWFLM